MNRKVNRELWVVFSAHGKELCAYSLAGTFASEARATAKLLAAENGLDVSGIEIKLVKR